MSKRQKREMISMELTPLIDVVFLLLIFFLVTSTFKKDEFALLLKLPTSQKGQGIEKEIKELTIEVSKDEIAFNGQKVPLTDLPERLKSVKKETLVQLRIDGEVQYTRVVKILDLLQQQKLENISLITEKEK